jgi:hypothetical protein
MIRPSLAAKVRSGSETELMDRADPTLVRLSIASGPGRRAIRGGPLKPVNATGREQG